MKKTSLLTLHSTSPGLEPQEDLGQEVVHQVTADGGRSSGRTGPVSRLYPLDKFYLVWDQPGYTQSHQVECKVAEVV
ncbi:unnamed protein product [Gadus morhua 'NCC']